MSSIVNGVYDYVAAVTKDAEKHLLERMRQVSLRLFTKAFIKLPDSDTPFLCMSGLCSGSRWTSFMNTMLNKLYSEVIHIMG